jgi:hypothetical protein
MTLSPKTADLFRGLSRRLYSLRGRDREHFFCLLARSYRPELEAALAGRQAEEEAQEQVRLTKVERELVEILDGKGRVFEMDVIEAVYWHEIGAGFEPYGKWKRRLEKKYRFEPKKKKEAALRPKHTLRNLRDRLRQLQRRANHKLDLLGDPRRIVRQGRTRTLELKCFGP